MSYRDKAYNTMKLEIRDEIAIVYFNRPEAHNAANIEMSYERLEIFSGISDDPNVRAVIITGNEKAYCSGGDLVAFSKFNRFEAEEFGRRCVEYQKLLMDMPKPTISAVAGYAYGGGMENVLLCDLRIAAENAKFALPEINVGIFPGGGGTQRLVQNISICQAKEMIFLGEPIDAKRAFEIGIVNKVVPTEQLMEIALQLAGKLCKKPPLSLMRAKEAINSAWGRDIYSGMEFEMNAWADIYTTCDQKEGMEAFLGKRKPKFEGK